MQGAALCIEKPAEPGDPQCFEWIGQKAGSDVAIFYHLTQPTRCAGVIAKHRPLAVRSTHQIAASGDDMATADWLDAARVFEKCRAGMHQFRRDQALAQQFLWAVNVGEDGVYQTNSLRQPGRHRGPVAGRN